MASQVNTYDDIVFQTFNWWSGDEHYNDDNDDDDNEIERFLIKTWGVDLDGQTVSVTIKGFPPYFYIKVPYNVTKRIEGKWRDWLLAKLSRRFQKSVQGVRCLKKKDFYGFKNNETWNFVRFSFQSIAAFRMAIRIFQNPVKIPGLYEPEQKYKLYESNIEPAIRMMHHQDIQPCGWIRIPKGYWSQNNDLLTTRSHLDVECNWKRLYNWNHVIGEKIAPVTIASFDIECSSSHGDFPLAQKSYQKLSNEIFAYYHQHMSDLDLKRSLFDEILLVFQPNKTGQLSKVFPKNQVNLASIEKTLTESIDDIYHTIQGKIKFKQSSEDETKKQNEKLLHVLTHKLGAYDDEGEWSGIFPMLLGDEITQIGITCHKYGERDVSSRYIISAGPCDPIPDAEVIVSDTEKKLLLDFTDLLTKLDPDIVTGFNILGFDLAYMYGRSRELGITNQFCRIGRIIGRESPYVIKNLSSSALGDNVLKYIDMEGRTIIDVMKVVQRDHKLDSYKLDAVANHFMKLNKKDVTPNQIFSLFKGSSSDRKVLAEYCIQDCALCNQLIIKLEILANNIGMANVCNVPLAYIFLRGQGIKIFSLVAKQCREDEFVVPSLARPWGTPLDEDDDGYEGAIVLEPETGIYVDDPISVLDFASLYPSSMISENLSHDCHLLDEDGGKYDNLPGVEYLDITYDVYKSQKSKKGKADKKIKIGEETRRFAQTTEGVLPRILKKLLSQRKLTRKRINYRTITQIDGIEFRGLAKYNSDTIDMVDVGSNASWQIDRSQVVSDVETYDEFQKAVLDGLQLAYKVTANSLYGQTGSRVSPVYMKEVAACTTATGRNMILMAKKHVEEVYNAHVIYGDTDSIFVRFETKDENGNLLRGRDALSRCRELGVMASHSIKPLLKQPHDLEWEKMFWPFILLSKKRYCANKYEFDDTKCKMNSMGIVLKRRDNANIVKIVYAEILDIILNRQDVRASIKFLRKSLNDIVQAKFPLEEFIISKTLKSTYTDPDRIAHKVLADRMKGRDPGNAPQVNDRLPYAYIEVPEKVKKHGLQGDRIEHPDYIREKKLKIDFQHYLENQIMNPVLQIYALILENLDGYKYKPNHFQNLERHLKEKKRAELQKNHEKIAGISQDEVEKIVMEKVRKKIAAIREQEVKKLIFDPILYRLQNKKKNMTEITDFFR